MEKIQRIRPIADPFLTHFQTLDVKLGELIEIRVVGAESEDRSLK